MPAVTLPRGTGLVLLLMSMALGQQPPETRSGTTATPEKQTLGLLPENRQARELAQAALDDNHAQVRASVAAALGEIGSQASLPPLKKRMDDPDPDTTKTLTEAAGDKNWLVRAASLEGLAKRGDPSVLKAIDLYLDDDKAEVKYTAAAAVLHLMDISEGGREKTKTLRAATPDTKIMWIMSSS